MERDELLRFLTKLFPEFSKNWGSEDNYFRNGDEYTVHGVCSQFSTYFKSACQDMSDSELHALFVELERIISADIENSDLAANALCTCFLENIAQTNAGNLAKAYLGESSRRFFEYWGVPTNTSLDTEAFRPRSA